MLNKIIYTILGIGIAFVFFPHTAHEARKPAVSGIAIQKAVAQIEKAAPELALNLSAPILSAKSAVAYDSNSGLNLYSKTPDEKPTINTLTQLMTAIDTITHAALTA